MARGRVPDTREGELGALPRPGSAALRRAASHDSPNFSAPTSIESPRGHQSHYTGQQRPIGRVAGDFIPAPALAMLRRRHEAAL